MKEKKLTRQQKTQTLFSSKLFREIYAVLMFSKMIQMWLIRIFTVIFFKYIHLYWLHICIKERQVPQKMHIRIICLTVCNAIGHFWQQLERFRCRQRIRILYFAHNFRPLQTSSFGTKKKVLLNRFSIAFMDGAEIPSHFWIFISYLNSFFFSSFSSLSLFILTKERSFVMRKKKRKKNDFQVMLNRW